MAYQERKVAISKFDTIKQANQRLQRWHKPFQPARQSHISSPFRYISSSSRNNRDSVGKSHRKLHG